MEFRTVAPRRRRRTGRGLLPYLLVAPSIAILLVVMVYPLAYSLSLSFFEWIIPKGPAWTFNAGMNYVNLMSDSRFWNAMLNTGIIAGASVSIEFALGLALALVFLGKIKGKRVLVPVLVLPMMMVPIMVGQIWRLMYLTVYGPIDQVLTTLGVQVDWLGHGPSALLAIIITNTWQWFPFMFLILLAGFSAIPIELYEASQIDGASKWQTFVHVTMPMAKTVVILGVVIAVMESVKIFDIIYLITGGGPGYATETISVYIFQLGFQFFNMGYASAASYVLLIIVTVIVTFFVRIMPRR